MRDRDVLKRIDGHLERGNELMGRVEEQMRLTRESHRVQIEEHRAFVIDNREFMSQMIRRVERIGHEQWRELSRLNDELERQGAERREESQMHRNAFLKVLDGLDRLDPPPAAA